MKEVQWIGSSRSDLKQFPKKARYTVGVALRWAQRGRKHASAKPLQGFGGGGVLEIFDSFEGDAYRAVYTVHFAERVYVLHCFQKKSKHGIATPKRQMELIRTRLKWAEEMHEAWLKNQRV